MVKRRVFAFVALAAFPAARSQAATCTPTTPNTVCVITTGTTSNPTASGVNFVTYAWDSATAGPKTQTVGFSCGGTGVANGFTFTVKDELGSAGANPIGVTPNIGDTIDTAVGPFVLNANFESITFQCDGNHNWLVE